VTIDLAGHALVGPGSSSGHGIYQNATNRNLRVANGKALNWLGSMKAGVFAGGSATVLTGLQVSTNYYGVFTGSGSSLSACAAQGNRSIGLFVSGASTLTGCTAIDNGDTGIFSYPGCSLTGCTAVQNGNNGISGSGCALASCTATYNHGDGIVAGDGGVLSGCSTYMNDGNGIHVLSGCLVTRCSADHNGFGGTNDGAGIYASSTQNRIEDNLVTYNDRGIDVDGTANFIARNSARGNTVNWDVVAGNVCLVIKATATTGAITGDSGGVAPGSTDPNANFTH
jgi:parallel beta-helix repeat protein